MCPRTLSGSTLVEQEQPQSRLEGSAPSPGLALLPRAQCRSSPTFCQAMGSVWQLRSGWRRFCSGLSAPAAETGSDSLVAASVVLQECLQTWLLTHSSCQLWRGLREMGKAPANPPPLLFLCRCRTACEPRQKDLLEIYCKTPQALIRNKIKGTKERLIQ